ncbi:unnamed protein product, partial [Ectocarpus fasciculatus]
PLLLYGHPSTTISWDSRQQPIHTDAQTRGTPVTMVAPPISKQEEEEEESVAAAATTPTYANASKTKAKAQAKSSSFTGKRRRRPQAVNGSADVAIAESEKSSNGNGSGKTAVEVEDDSRINEEARALIELEKPRLWRSLEELRDRARDVEEKVAALKSRAREEQDE